MAQVRENQMDNPEFVDMMLQRWFIQKGAAKGAAGCWCGECLQRPCQDSVSTIWLRGANLLRNSGSCNVDNSEILVPSQIIQGHAGGIGVASVSVDTLNHIG